MLLSFGNIPRNFFTFTKVGICERGRSFFFSFWSEVREKKGDRFKKKRVNYYPFGLKHKGYNNVTSSIGNPTAQKFGYNGKELNEELGLEWHDFGARNYDASLGRWMNIDNASEEYYDFSGYSYVANSPIIATDPDGQRIVVIGDDDYRAEVFKSFLQLARTKAGFEYLANSINSKNTFVIQKGKGENVAYARQNNEDGTYTQYLDFSPSKSTGTHSDGSVQNVETTLAHEFDHFLNENNNRTWPVYNGKTYTDDEFNVYQRDFKGSEPLGVEAGNKIRATYGQTLRRIYDGINVYDMELSKRVKGKLVPVGKSNKFDKNKYKGQFSHYPSVIRFLAGSKYYTVPPSKYSNKNTFPTLKSAKEYKANVYEKGQ